MPAPKQTNEQKAAALEARARETSAALEAKARRARLQPLVLLAAKIRRDVVGLPGDAQVLAVDCANRMEQFVEAKP